MTLRLRTAYFCITGEETSDLYGLSVATQESAGRSSYGGLAPIKPTEMTRFYVPKRALSEQTYGRANEASL